MIAPGGVGRIVVVDDCRESPAFGAVAKYCRGLSGKTIHLADERLGVEHGELLLDLVAVSNCAPSFKPALDQGSGRTQIVRMNFIVSSISNIVLKIDPAIVLATREYVDLSITEALNKQDFKHSVLVATTANIVLSGLQTVDGVALAADDRVLVKDQTQAKNNGVYVVPAAGAWKRAQDADASVEVTPGLFVSVEKGTTNGDSVWQLVTDAPIVLGTTALTFEVVAGRTGIVAGTYRSLSVDKLGRVIAGTNPTTLAGAGIVDAISSAPQPGTAGAISDIQKTTFGTYASGTTDKPSDGGLFMRIKYPSDGLAIDFAGHAGTASSKYFLRRSNAANGIGPWDEIWHSANFDPSSKMPTTGGLYSPALGTGQSSQCGWLS
ncbi:phage tail protein [Pseudomonas sivasensis]|uniref:phage tail-collar fiber domain-containing protein n=1 Tax=Pseudomonas sivasensis TaxID=1880678 RepID=UPI003CFDFE57